jgi:P-type Cu+ transporter
MAHEHQPRDGDHAPPAAEPSLVVDPVCGMKVNPERARGGSFEHAGHTFHFCNPKCRERFSAEPERYLSKAKPNDARTADVGPISEARAKAAAAPVTEPVTARSSQAVVYVCPMDPEVRSERPGACPKCGMALEPEQPQRGAAAQEPRPKSSSLSVLMAAVVAFIVAFVALHLRGRGLHHSHGH